VAFESENVFAQSNSAGRGFQVDGAASEKVRRASSVCMRGTTSASVEVAGYCSVSRMTVKPQVGINGHAKRLEL